MALLLAAFLVFGVTPARTYAADDFVRIAVIDNKDGQPIRGRTLNGPS